MDILIVEDEKPAALRLQALINELRPSCQIVNIVDSIQTATSWLKSNDTPNLIFMDIQLADGLSFDIFSEVDVKAPVIFTTAYDQYTLKAFKYNSIDYLLKPIDTVDLEASILQYEKLHEPQKIIDKNTILSIIESFQKQGFKERFLVKSKDQLSYVNTKEVAYFYSEDGVLFLTTDQGKRYMLDNTIDKLLELLDPKFFYRINRKLIVRHEAIDNINFYFNSRLKLDLKPQTSFDVIVARERVKGFKAWLDS